MNDKPPSQDMSTGNAGASPLPAGTIPVLPVRSTVLFPGVIVPLAIGRERSIAAVEEALRSELPVAVLMQRDPDVSEPDGTDLHDVGTVASVLRFLTGRDGTHHLVCQGDQRFRVREFVSGLPFLAVRIDRIEEPDEKAPAMQARLHQLKTRAQEALAHLPQAPQELQAAVAHAELAGSLADMIAGLIDVSPAEKQQVLETVELEARVDRVLSLLSERLEVIRLSEEIGKRTAHTMGEQQRKHLLREQLKTIQQELGEDGGGADVEELRQRLDEAQLPESARKEADRELARLERIPESSMEYSITRDYLDWLALLPWSRLSEENIDIARAREVLDADHYGLHKIKRRLLEFLAVRKLNPEGRSPILCFVGPPGVGKTSLGQSIARALGLEFVRVSLGGVHDESEIRGHRRTYVGAMPGIIIQNIRKAGVRNPLMMLDEMDKLGRGVHGDPSAAMLEVLDPAQNDTFRDNYLNVPFDLSRVLFIATANVLDAIPGPLRDRMEVIDLPGYTEEEKVEIARRYLVERQISDNGLKPQQITITEEALHDVVRYYTREAGVRNLERAIGNICRHVAVRIAEGKDESMVIGSEQLHGVLGPRRFESEMAMRTSVPGVATGLAWTAAGGDILFIEASRSPGKGQLILTGQLGEVMKESAQAALSLVKARAADLELTPEHFEHHDIHVHVPAGAIPKDGPSAGVAMFLALVSVLSGKTLPSDLAMTGEISLRGLVLPVGGIKEKMVAAARAGIRKVMLPRRNQPDHEEIPESARNSIEFVWLDTVDDALETALGWRPGHAEGE